MTDKKAIVAYVSEDFKKQVEKRAKELNISVGAYIRLLLSTELKK